ncbi:MAG: isoprenylcysteine carboxylmethyltransferase family protein [Ignavibacteriales bacterium]|nr:isoprenylcysteine carboxylmethyltransferase family protein [Ignavibacteriales bacterium]
MKLKIATFILLTFILLPLIIWRLLSKFPHDLMTYIGITLIIPSFVLLIIAIFQLGDSLAVTPQAKELVTKGLYSKIRHPMYVFGMLLFLGFAMVTRDVISYVVCAFALVNVIWRVRRENRVLEEKFGDAYRTYRKQVWF